MERLRPRPDLLVGKSAEVAQYAEQRARELLTKHPDLVTPEVVDLIAQRETALALQEYGKRRLDGYENDDFSLQPGLTVYLTHKGRDKVVEFCEHEGYPIMPTQIEKVTPHLFALRLPRGIYMMGGGGAQFYQEATPDWKRSGGAEKPFAASYDWVVRIEGDANELWQNVNYQWNGQRKSRTKRV